MGIRTVMITGDNPLTAAAIAQEAGVDDFLAEATPEAKMALIKQEQEVEQVKQREREDLNQEKINSMLQDFEFLNKKIDDQANTILQQMEKRASDSTQDLQIKHKELHNMIKTLRKDVENDLHKIENSQLDLFPRILGCQRNNRLSAPEPPPLSSECDSECEFEI